VETLLKKSKVDENVSSKSSSLTLQEQEIGLEEELQEQEIGLEKEIPEGLRRRRLKQ
jgi:hypothetical protein